VRYHVPSFCYLLFCHTFCRIPDELMTSTVHFVAVMEVGSTLFCDGRITWSLHCRWVGTVRAFVDVVVALMPHCLLIVARSYCSVRYVTCIHDDCICTFEYIDYH